MSSGKRPVVFTTESAKLIADVVRAVKKSTLVRKEDRHPQAPCPQTVVPDGYAYDTIRYSRNPPGRQTLNRCLERETDPSATGNRVGEFEIHNVGKVLEGSSSIPFFVSEQTLTGPEANRIEGEMYWATVDSKRYAVGGTEYYSLEVADKKTTGSEGKWNIGIWGFQESDESTACYSKKITVGAGYGKQVEWRWPVRCFVGAAQDPCNTSAVQNKVVARMASTLPTPTGTYATLSFWERNLTVRKGALEIEGESSSQLFIYIPVTIDPDDITVDPSKIAHTDLSFSSSTAGKAGNNADHDARYLRIGGNWTGETYNNTCDGIAHDTAGAYGIKFSTGKLLDGNHVEAVYYGARTLLKTTAERSIDWENAVLGETTGWYCSRAFIAGRDPRYGGTTFYSAHTFYSKPFEIEAESTNAGGLLCKSQPAAGYNYFGFNEAGCTDVARFGTQGGQERVKIMSVASAVDRTLVLQAVDGTVQMIADGTNKTVTLTNLRLDAGGGNWIGFTATNGQLIIVDQSGNQLGLLAKEEPA